MEKLPEKSKTGSRRRLPVGLLAAALVVSVSAAPNKTTAAKKSPSAASGVTVLEKKSLSAASAKDNPMTRVKSSMLDMPLSFEINKGQTDPKVKYLTRAQSFTVFVMQNETVLSGRDGNVLRMKLRNANRSPEVLGEKRQTKISNYYIGNDSSKWLDGVPNFGQVRSREVYSGIDLIYHSDQRQLEYDFVVKPGADPDQIRVAFEGASKIRITSQGDLELTSGDNISVNHKPVVYQMIDGRRKLVQGEYTLANNVAGFQIGEYDRTQPLVIDPTLQVLAIFGGTLNDETAGVGTSALPIPTSAGVVIVGRSQSPTLPGPANKTTASINWDAVAIGLNGGTAGVPDSAGTTILWTTYIGGSGDDAFRGVVLDNQGNIYAAGYTNSVDFPGVGPASGYDALLVKLAAAGGARGTTSLYGGPGVDQATSVALDYSTFSSAAKNGGGDPVSITSPATDTRVIPNVVIGGFTSGNIGGSGSPVFALAGGTGDSAVRTPDGNQRVYNQCTVGAGCGQTDGFVAIFSNTFTLRHATYIGGGGNDQVNGVAADIWGNVYATGYATPAAPGFAQPAFPVVNGIGRGNAGGPPSVPQDAALAGVGNAVAFVAKWACATNDGASIPAGTPGTFPIGVPSPPPRIQACGGRNNLAILSNSALFGGSGSSINPAQTFLGQQAISEAGLAIAVDLNGWGSHAVSSGFLLNVGQVGIRSVLNFGFPVIVPHPDFAVTSTTTTLPASVIVSPQPQPLVEPCGVPPGRVVTDPNANFCVATPAPGQSSQGGFQPGVAGPHVYVVGSTANANFADSLLNPSCAQPPVPGTPFAVPALCAPFLTGASVLIGQPLPNPNNGPARIVTVPNGANSGQTQGWLVAFEFPAVTQAVVTPPSGSQTLVTTLAPPTVPLYIVLQPPTCPGYASALCVQGAATPVVGPAPAPLQCQNDIINGGVICPTAFIGSWHGVAVDSDQQVYVIGQIGMSGQTAAAFGVGPANRLALEMERISPLGVPQLLYPNPVAQVTSSFLVDSGAGNNFCQILPGSPPSPNPNQPGGLSCGIAVNPLREAFFAGTSTVATPNPAAGTNATVTLAVAGGVVTIVSQTGGTGYLAAQVPNVGTTLAVAGTTGCSQVPLLGVSRTGGVLTFSFAPQVGFTGTNTATNGGAACTSAAGPTVTVPAAPSGTAVSSNYLLTNAIEAPLLPTPATQFNLGGLACLDPSGKCAQNAATGKTGTGPEDILYGAVQFYDAIADTPVLNFSATVNQVASITAPDGTTGSVGAPPIPLAKGHIHYKNWQSQELNIPPGCTVAPNLGSLNVVQPGTNATYAPFNILPILGTSEFEVTVNPIAVQFPGVVTVFAVFDKAGPCAGVGQPVGGNGTPLDGFDPVTLTLTVSAPLNIVPEESFGTLSAPLTSKLASGIIDQYIVGTGSGRQLVANQQVQTAIDVSTASALGPINFTVQIVPGLNWQGPVQNAVVVSNNAPTTTIFEAVGPSIAAATRIPITINTAVIAGLPIGRYTAKFVFSPSPETPALPTSGSTACDAATSPVGSGSISPTCKEIVIDVVGTQVANVPATLVFGASTTTQQTQVQVANPTGSPYTFTAGYQATPVFGTALPATNVFFVGTGTTSPTPATVGNTVGGTIAAGGLFSLPIQINPNGLTSGVYSGQILISNTTTAAGATPQTTVPILVYIGPRNGEDLPPGLTTGVGNGLGLMLPVNTPPAGDGLLPGPTTARPTQAAPGLVPAPSTGAYPITISVASGYGPTGVNQIPNPTPIEVTGLNNNSLTAYNVRPPVVSASLPGVSITSDAVFGSIPLSCNGTFAQLASLPGTSLGPPCVWFIHVDATALNASNTRHMGGACNADPNNDFGTTGTLTFNPDTTGIQFAPLVVPVVLCVTDFPQLVLGMPNTFPNPTFGGGLVGFIPQPANVIPGFTQSIVEQMVLGVSRGNGVRTTATPINLLAQAGNSSNVCKVVDLHTNGGVIPTVTIAQLPVQWVSVRNAQALFLGPAVGAPGGFNGVVTAIAPTAPYTIAGLGTPGLNAIPGTPPFTAGPFGVGPGLITFEICVNTDPLGNAAGVFSTTVSINGAGVGAIDIPVNIQIGNVGSGGGGGGTGSGINLSQLGVFRNTTTGPNTGLGQWFFAGSSNTFDASSRGPRWFGLNGDVGVAGDWDGTGAVRIGVFRCPALGVCQWYIDMNNNGQWDGTFGGDAIWNFGLTGDQPVVGDWNGDGKTEIGVMRCPAAGVCTWYLDIGNKHTYDPATVGTYLFGLTGDKAVAGPFAGVPNVDNIGVFRCPAVGVCQWFVDTTGQTGLSQTIPGPPLAAGAIYNFGLIGDIPVVANWNNNGPKRIGIFRGGAWYVDTNGNHVFDPAADQIFNFGLAGDQGVAGFWTLP